MENKELQTLQEETTSVLSISRNLEITDDETLSNGIDFLKDVKRTGKNIKEQKDKLVKPIKVALKNAQGMFKAVEDMYKESEVVVKEKIKVYTADKEDFSCEGQEGKISVRKLTKLVITDSEILPSKYLIKVPNEKLIKEDLLNGIEVPGAKVVINRTIASL